MSDRVSSHRSRVLVVDDVPTNVKMLCSALASDYEVRFATSGAQALELVQQSRPDLILLDVMMPGMSGHEVHRALRENPDTRVISVIFVTADTSSESEMEGLRLGADDYITKPFVIPIVLARVHNLLERSRLQRDLELSMKAGNQGLWEWDVDSADVSFNAYWGIALGYSVAEKPCVMQWEYIVHPADWAVLRAARDAYLAAETNSFEPEVRLRHKNDSYVWMQLHGSAVDRNKAGRPTRMMGTYTVISRRKEAELALRENEQRLATVIASMQDAVIVVDVAGMVTLFHTPQDTPLSYLTNTVLGSNYRDTLPTEFLVLLDSVTHTTPHARQPIRHELTLTLDGRKQHLQLAINHLATADDEPTGTLIVIQDVTARRLAEDEIRALAFYDPLTRLPNRRLLRDRMRMAMANSARSSSYGAVVLIDLDNFKQINDGVGHGAGDQLLIDVAERLLRSVRSTDTVARLGGDEFFLILEDLGTEESDAGLMAQRICEKVLAALGSATVQGGGDFNVTASIGVSLFIGNEQTEDSLVKNADVAMYSAKSDGRNAMRFFDPVMAARVAEHLGLEQAIHHSLQKGDFFLLYHPQVDRHGQMVGVEALARWNHPERGICGPSQFMSVAEDTGLIVPLGIFIFETACAQLAAWQSNLATAHLSMAVNIGAVQFQRVDFFERVVSTIQRSNINPAYLKLEITESVLFSDVENVMARMAQLANIGVRISLDDFGTGYSSLAYLKQLPIHEIKIDPSFVRHASGDPVDLAIVKAIGTLGRSLGLTVVAEGVETLSEWEMLCAEACDEFQGYYFSLPVSAGQITALVAAERLPVVE